MFSLTVTRLRDTRGSGFCQTSSRGSFFVLRKNDQGVKLTEGDVFSIYLYSGKESEKEKV